MVKDRYYVQPLTPQVFLIRERRAESAEQERGDRLVRSFAIRHDADLYASAMNEKQEELDKQYGHWVQHAF